MDPGTKRILFGDENQRIHDMHIRRLVTLSDELKEADIRLFQARLALKEFLEEKDAHIKNTKSVKLATAMFKLRETEQKVFKTNFLQTVAEEHKPAVHGWEQMYEASDRMDKAGFLHLEKTENSIKWELESLIARNTRNVIVNHTPIEPSASFWDLVDANKDVMIACKEVKELWVRMMTNPSQIKGNPEIELVELITDINNALFDAKHTAGVMDINPFGVNSQTIDNHLGALMENVLVVEAMLEYVDIRVHQVD